ncbi:ADP-L-glycero-D-manno-heptose-6-epimerase [Prochlorococcus marinus str. MIT 9321]|nr:ADP-L-glycero-D-manno-heptose-6-epimerase [Prochlorococcus marinus str. MIT 9321]
MITGGLGFIGSIAANYFHKKFQILVFDNPRNEIIDYFSKIPLNLVSREGGIQKIFDFNPDIILHLGAKSNTDLDNADLAYFSNTDFTNKLIDYSIKRKIKLIYASSAATYGDGSNGFDDTDKFHDLIKLKPLNLYGWSKHNSDLFFSDYLDNNPKSENIIGLKFFNVFGKNELHKKHMASVISKMIPKIKNNEKINLFKHFYQGLYCEAERDFIFVDDICRIFELLMGMDFKSSIYNVGTGTSSKFSKLIEVGFNSLGRKPLIEFIDLPKQYHGKYQMRTKAPMKRLIKLLNGFEFTSIEDAVPKLL